MILPTAERAIIYIHIQCTWKWKLTAASSCAQLFGCFRRERLVVPSIENSHRISAQHSLLLSCFHISTTLLHFNTLIIANKPHNRPHSLLLPSLCAVAQGCKQGPNAPPEYFLGLLSSSEGFKIYGGISNTKTRFLIATPDDTSVPEEDVKMVFSRIIFSFL